MTITIEQPKAEATRVDRTAWHAMMARAYECMDEIEMVVGSEKCEHCGEWHPIPKHWPKRIDE